MTAPRDLVEVQASTMLAVLGQRYPGSMERLSANAPSELAAGYGVTLRFVRQAQDPTGARDCSVAGMYLDDQDPPMLVIAATASPGRRAFTALHEFGHHIQRTEASLITPLFGQPDHGLALEEAACDAFAANVLLPDELVGRYLGPDGPTGPEIVDLWRASSASKEAVCVKASQRLRSPGHVVLLDRSGHVTFAVGSGLPPIARGSDQSAVPVVRDALERSGRAVGRARLEYANRVLGGELYAQIVPMKGYLLMVSVVDGAPWESFTLSSKDSGPSGGDWICADPACSREFTTFSAPCERCVQPRCPDCGRCACRPETAEVRCDGCFQVLPVALFAVKSGTCDDCV